MILVHLVMVVFKGMKRLKCEVYEFKGLGGLQSINQKGLVSHEHEGYEVLKVTKCHSSKY